MSDRAPSQPPSPPPATQQEPEATVAEVEVEVKEEETAPLLSPTTSVVRAEATTKAPSPSPARSTKSRRTEACRRALLQDDPLVEVVQPDVVLCRSCKKWIRLSTLTTYCLNNWQAHKMRCSGSFPASRVATAERKIVLLNDPQVRNCAPRHVVCRNCRTEVDLDSNVDYDLTKWTEHKDKCIPVIPPPITPQEASSDRPRVFPPPSSSTQSPVSADPSARSPTPVGDGSSSNLTESTAVGEGSPAAVKAGVKRAREDGSGDEEGEGEKDVRPTNRPRTETYTPPEKEAPGVFGWMMLPLQEFARGFREGMGST